MDYFFPAGGEQGTTVTLTLGGKLDPWPVKMWSSCKDLVLAPAEKKGEVVIQIPKEVPLGPHLMRVFTEEGASRARAFLVDRITEIPESENNNSYKTAQKIDTTPIVVNGRLERGGDTDSFAADLAAGQWLIAKVDGYGIGSPIDPTLHLRDSGGNRVTESYDSQNLDPLLAYQAKSAGTYILQIDAFAHIPRFEVRLFGSAASVYRLSIYTGPFARYPYPLAVAKGSKSRLQLYGWNFPVEAGGLAFAEIDATAVPRRCFEFEIAGSVAPNHLAVKMSEYPQLLEAEPNNSRDTAQRIGHPFGISGRICPKADEDWFAVELAKDEQIKLTLLSSSLGFSLDPVLTIQNSEGKPLLNIDDADGTWDPAASWRAPEDGTYFVQVGDRYGMGGDDFVYYMEGFKPIPTIQAAVEKDALRIDGGTTTSLKVTVTLIDGYSAPLIATALDLPAGVTSTSAPVPEKGGEVTLVLSAAPDAKPHSGLFRVLVLSTDAESPGIHAGAASLDVELPVGRQLIQRTDQLWLTIVPPAAKETPPAPTG